MYILRFHDRDEFEQMKISDSVNKLKEAAIYEIDGILDFIIEGEETMYIMCKGHEIGVIGEIEQI